MTISPQFVRRFVFNLNAKSKNGIKTPTSCLSLLTDEKVISMFHDTDTITYAWFFFMEKLEIFSK